MTSTNPPAALLSRARFLRLAALAGLAGIAACSRGNDPTTAGTTPVRGGRLVFARNQDVVSLDPVRAGDNGSIFILYNVVDTLVTINADSSDVEPALAEEWRVSPDGRTYTFRLRGGVRFSDGSALSEQDVVFSLDRARAPEAAYGFLFDTVTAVRAAGAGVVEVELSRPHPPLLENLSIFAAGVVSRAAVTANPDAVERGPVATGPFRVESSRRGDRTVLVRNEHYWKADRPYLDRVEFPIVDSDDSRVLALRSGDVHVVEAVPPAQADRLDGVDGVDVAVEPVFGLSTIYLDHGDPLIADRRVRRALNLAVDRDAVLSAAYFGIGEVANSTVPRQRGWAADVPRYPHDPRQAAELVAQAGAGGRQVALLVSGGDSVAVATAQIVEQGWRAAGLDPRIEKVDFSTLVDRYTKQDFTALLGFETADVTSPWEMPLLHYKVDSPNKGMYTSYANDELADLVRRGSTATDPVEQTRLLREAQRLALDEVPMVPLVFLSAATGTRSAVGGFRTAGTGWWKLEDVWLSA